MRESGKETEEWEIGQNESIKEREWREDRMGDIYGRKDGGEGRCIGRESKRAGRKRMNERNKEQRERTKRRNRKR